MYNVYDRTRIIVFDNGMEPISCTWPVEIDDYEDYFIIETQIAIDQISRGWLGDIKFVLAGSNIDEINSAHQMSVSKDVVYKDVLCVRCIFNLTSSNVAVWKYTFNKY